MQVDLDDDPPPRSALLDLSLLGVVLGNLVAIVLAYFFEWNLGEVMWVYWGQSVTIGVTNVLRMLRLRDFTTRGLRMNDEPVPETQDAKRGVAVFFAIHYGFFHFVYALFLWSELPLNTLVAHDRMLMILCVMAFVLSHGYSLQHNRRADFRQKKPNLGTLMMYPYLRVVPMHLAILLGEIAGDGRLFLFLGLKAIADAGMHMVEHRLFRGPGRAPLGVEPRADG